jgi:hypothetical protein
MANSYTSQVIKDTTEHVVIKLTGSFDGTGQEANTARIVANTLAGALATNGYPVANVHGGSANTTLAYYGLALNRLWYDCTSNGDVQLSWTADTPQTLMMLSGNGEFDGMGNWTTIPNNAGAGKNGDIGLTTRNMTAGDSYTMIIELRKENEYYSRGQFVDPAAFNYGAYSRTP